MIINSNTNGLSYNGESFVIVLQSFKYMSYIDITACGYVQLYLSILSDVICDTSIARNQLPIQWTYNRFQH